jgi:hypothetical protein
VPGTVSMTASGGGSMTASDGVSAAGVEGNSRLTAVNGMLLLGLLAVEGATILNVRHWITLHVYLGLLLIGPVLLKCASTVYRFARYYGGRRPYVAKGPPHPALRVLGPVVILSSLAVLGTGIGLIFTGPNHRDPLLTLHQASFFVWFGAMTLHVLGHVLDAATTSWRELRDRRGSPAARRRGWRTTAVVASLVAGVGLATALLPSAHTWTSHQYDRHEHPGIGRGR